MHVFFLKWCLFILYIFLNLYSVNGSDSDSDIEMLMSSPLSETLKHHQVRPNTETMDINRLITQFKHKTINENVPRQLFTVC